MNFFVDCLPMSSSICLSFSGSSSKSGLYQHDLLMTELPQVSSISGMVPAVFSMLAIRSDRWKFNEGRNFFDSANG